MTAAVMPPLFIFCSWGRKITKYSGIFVFNDKVFRNHCRVMEAERGGLITGNCSKKTIKRKKRKKRIRSDIHGFLFSGIPVDVRISDFKDMIRSSGARLTFITWKGNRRAAKVFFEGEREDVLKCLDNFRIGEELITITEIEENPRERCNEANERTVIKIKEDN